MEIVVRCVQVGALPSRSSANVFTTSSRRSRSSFQEEQAGSGGDFGLDLAARTGTMPCRSWWVSGTTRALLPRCVASRPTLSRRNASRTGMKLDSEVGRDLPEGELLPGPQRASQDRVAGSIW